MDTIFYSFIPLSSVVYYLRFSQKWTLIQGFNLHVVYLGRAGNPGMTMGQVIQNRENY